MDSPRHSSQLGHGVPTDPADEFSPDRLSPTHYEDVPTVRTESDPISGVTRHRVGYARHLDAEPAEPLRRRPDPMPAEPVQVIEQGVRVERSAERDVNGNPRLTTIKLGGF